jgi:heat-inducible transcriptional repressor
MIVRIDERKKKILQAVVRNFILTGKPVGSVTVAESAGLRVSTATIRNEMAVLEELGLLQQPHTSAGRVPTDIAYRYYVDMLMGLPRPSSRDTEAIEKLFDARTREIEGIFQEVSVLLSRLTHTTAMVFAPFTAADVVRHIDLIKLGQRRVMVIVVTSKAQVGRRILNMAEEVSSDTISRVALYLERSMIGIDVAKIATAEIVERARFGPAGRELLLGAVNAVQEYLGEIEERVFIGGTANIVREMDIAGPEWAQVLLEAMEKQYLILDLLKDLLREQRLTVRIGEENSLRELQRCAFIGTSYPIGSKLQGSLGVVGPTCLDYERTIGMVELMADNLGRRLQQPSD